MDWLVTVLETPVFAFLRLDLAQGDPALLRALHALLALLPQSDAYRTLAERLRSSTALLSIAPQGLHAANRDADPASVSASAPQSTSTRPATRDPLALTELGAALLESFEVAQGCGGAREGTESHGGV